MISKTLIIESWFTKDLSFTLNHFHLFKKPFLCQHSALNNGFACCRHRDEYNTIYAQMRATNKKLIIAIQCKHTSGEHGGRGPIKRG